MTMLFCFVRVMYISSDMQKRLYFAGDKNTSLAKLRISSEISEREMLE